MAVSPSFASKVASYIGAPPDRVLQILNQWQPYEGGSAAYNPLNTTQGGPGVVSNYNDVGVKNFANEDSGAAATAATLLNGYYPDIVNWMRTGELNTANVVKQLKTWGTVHFADAIGGGASPSTGGTAVPTSATLNAYAAAYQQLLPLEQKAQKYGGFNALHPDAAGNWNAYPSLLPDGRPDPSKAVLVFTAQEAKQYQALKTQVDTLKAQAVAEQVDPATIIKVQQAAYGASNGSIDAENAAAKYARDVAVANAAAADARQRYGDQMTIQGNSIKSFNQWASGHQAGESAPVPSLYLPTQDQLFEKSLAKIKSTLPDVPGLPYYSADQQSAIAGAAQPSAAAQIAGIQASAAAAPPMDTSAPSLPSGYGATSGLGDASSVANAPITPSILADPNTSIAEKLNALRLGASPFRRGN